MLLAIVLFLVILALIAYLDTRKPKNFPPGPRWLPFLGSILYVMKHHRKHKYLITSCAELGKEFNTTAVGLKLGRDLLVVVNSPRVIREFLASEDLSGRPDGTFFRSRTWGERLGVMLTDSEFWKEQRRFSLRHLREFGFGRRDMSAMVEEEAENIIKYFKERMRATGGKVVEYEMETLFNVHVLNTLWTMLAGIRYKNDDKNLKHLQDVLAELFKRAHMIGTLFSHFPVLRVLAPEYSGYNTYIRAHQPLWDFLRRELSKHKETFNSTEARDFMDMYIKMLNAEHKPSSFTEKQLIAICLDLFIAGSETTSKTLSFSFQYLILYPEVQKKAQEEIDKVVGRDRRVTLDDRPR